MKGRCFMMNNENRTAMYWTTKDHEKLNDIREGCNEAVKVVLADYDPLNGMPIITEPDPRNFLIFGKSFEEYSAAMAKFTEIQHQADFRERKFRDALNHISELINSGNYKMAARVCREAFPAKFSEGCVRILAHAAMKEAPLHRRSNELTSRVNHARERNQKIREGIRAFFDF